MKETVHKRPRGSATAVAVGLGLGLLLAVPFVVMDHARPQQSPWSLSRSLFVEASFWELWVLAVPLLTRMARRFPLDARSWKRSLPVHVAAAPVFAAAHLAFDLLLINPIQGYPHPVVERFLVNLGTYTPIFGVLTYGLLLLGIHAYSFAQRYHEEALRAAALEAQLVRSQLAALRSQLQPHFLFNTLHAISALMYQDVEAADRMITRLSELLRASLRRAPQDLIPLREELDFLQGYLEIEQARLGDRLSVRAEIDAEVLGAAVPNLILQPLVENAVLHGIAPRRRAGSIAVHARRTGGDLEILVRDDGPGLPAGPLREGIGLGNTRARLQRLYGASHRFALREAPGGGLEVALTFPFHEAEADVDHPGADR